MYNQNKSSAITIKASSLNKTTLKIYYYFLIKYFSKLNLKFSIISLPKKKKKITLLSSPHVFKKAREQFEIVTYSFVISIFNLSLKHIRVFSPKTVKTLIIYK